MTFQRYLAGITERARKFVFLGGSGSGKSETAIAFALELSKQSSRRIHFFDMDQSKPVYRSRDVKSELQNAGIIFHASHELMDAPTVPAAVAACLQDEERLVLMDIGGNEMGAVNMGQYRKFVLKDDALVYFVVNSYRPFFQDAEKLSQRIESIKKMAGVETLHYAVNPYLGIDMSEQDFQEGCARTRQMLKDLQAEPALFIAPKALHVAQPSCGLPLLQIKSHFHYGG